MSATTPEQKIAKAKALLIAATRQRRREYKLAREADWCRCGHQRKDHAVTCSINYTEGMCMTKGCTCRWFLFTSETERPATTATNARNRYTIIYGKVADVPEYLGVRTLKDVAWDCWRVPGK